MLNSRVLRFPISGEKNKNKFYLLQVLSNGSKPLDLKLLGTEGEAWYVAKLRHKRINEFKASHGHCTDEEWEQILIHTLVEPDSFLARDIEIKADTQSDGFILNFRKNIEGITAKLGTIHLEAPQSGSEDERQTEELSLFDWCVDAIGSRVKVVEELAAAAYKADELEKSATELKQQLEELIKAKEDDETQLLEKFRDLLNEKKLKIRQQQRLLASADVDPGKLEKVGGSQSIVRKAKASRAGKRKAQPSSDDSDDGFERMDTGDPVDIKDEPRDDEDVDQQETTDAETASEADDNDEDAITATAATKAIEKGRGKTAPARVPPRGSRAPVSPPRESGTSKEANREGDDDDIPPRRELPFKTKAIAPSKPVDDDETESDDEL
ncbi:hypothetical protein BJ170DRAFT_597856 [Xylariales sp. AK1849]|nr:hypothetical protein BJ170DRAFT_597856 [Xylariales sp. AK1849]